MKHSIKTSHRGISILLLLAAGTFPALQAAESGGAITGVADPNTQIVVTGLDSSQVTGVMSKCDGTYRVSGLNPGRYAIVESGPHHAARKLSVKDGEESHVDLAPQSSIKSKCP
jgi:hypothetical protein